MATIASVTSVSAIVIFFIPLVDEFETFNCITAPCEMPKITIFESFQKQYSIIDNFEECVSAGNPIMESHPRQCRTTDGKHFVEKINS
ncbi:hypothetical protein [Nitrosopumilus sp. S6]